MDVDSDILDGDAGSLSPLELEAAKWVIARDQGMSAEQRSAFAAWLAADQRHASMFAEMDGTWSQLDTVKSAAAPSSTQANVERFPAARRSAWPWLAGLGIAAAAAITFVVASRKTLPTPDSPATYSVSATTEVGGARTLKLPDGSEIQLNTDSAVTVTLTRNERRIELSRGEAYFHVAKDASRPFLVAASHIVVRAVGTEFDVHLRPSEVVVMVTEGKVRVSDAVKGTSLLPGAGTGEPPILAAGERAVVPVPAGTPSAATPAKFVADEQEQALAWKTGRLEFVDVPLTQIVEEFNRYNRHKLVIGDPTLAGRRFGGTFATTDHDAFVRVLENEFGISAERRDTETILRASR